MKLRRIVCILLLLYLGFTELVMLWTEFGWLLFPFSLKFQPYLFAIGMAGYGSLSACLLFLAVKILVLFAWILALLDKWHYQVIVGGLLVIDGVFCVAERLLRNEYAGDIPWLWLGVLFSLAAGAVLIYDGEERMRHARKGMGTKTNEPNDQDLA